MNPAVDLVEAYLRWNGYFTLTEYPVHRTIDLGPGVAQATDIDILALRLPRQRTSVAASSTIGAASTGELVLATDPGLDLDDRFIDVIIGEVKEGEAAFNPGLLDPAILHAVIDRVGCCFHEDAPDLAVRLARDGLVRVEGPMPVRLRLACFAGRGVTVPHCVTVVPLAAVVDFLYSRLRSHADLVRGTQFSGQALGLLHLMSKLDGDLGFSASHAVSLKQTHTA